MTIPEACQLILQAGTMGRGGEIYILDMGEPVKIVDLARDLASASPGFEVDDIAIVFSGVRPGEKLFEGRLSSFDAERAEKTRHPTIFVLASCASSPLEAVERGLARLHAFVGWVVAREDPRGVSGACPGVRVPHGRPDPAVEDRRGRQGRSGAAPVARRRSSKCDGALATALRNGPHRESVFPTAMVESWPNERIFGCAAGTRAGILLGDDIGQESSGTTSRASSARAKACCSARSRPRTALAARPRARAARMRASATARTRMSAIAPMDKRVPTT